jgi:hypothetical protein
MSTFVWWYPLSFHLFFLGTNKAQLKMSVIFTNQLNLLMMELMRRKQIRARGPNAITSSNELGCWLGEGVRSAIDDLYFMKQMIWHVWKFSNIWRQNDISVIVSGIWKCIIFLVPMEGVFKLQFEKLLRP